MTSFSYTFPRTGDVYHVFVSSDVFHHAHRHVGRVGQDPIVYDSVEELPDGPRQDIEQRIEERKK